MLHFKNEELRKVNIFESYNLFSKYFALNILFSFCTSRISVHMMIH